MRAGGSWIDESIPASEDRQAQIWLPTGQLIQMAVKSVFDVNNYVWTENVVTSPASEARLVCMADSSEILENPLGKGQLAGRCIRIG